MPTSLTCLFKRENHHRSRSSGFSLPELAIVLVIISLLVGGMLLPLSAQQDIRNTAETTRQLAEIRDALTGFAIVHGYFPCPATSTSDGQEDRTGNACTGGKRKGPLPWVTLGFQSSDSWGHLFAYSVTPAFADSTTRFSLTTSADITIKTRDSAGNLINLTNANDIPVAIHSTGKNGYWSWTVNSTAQNADSPNANDDEDTNSGTAATGKIFVSRTPTESTSNLGEFDDIVTWISPNILYNRMISAGRLP